MRTYCSPQYCPACTAEQVKKHGLAFRPVYHMVHHTNCTSHGRQPIFRRPHASKPAQAQYSTTAKALRWAHSSQGVTVLGSLAGAALILAAFASGAAPGPAPAPQQKAKITLQATTAAPQSPQPGPCQELSRGVYTCLP